MNSKANGSGARTCDTMMRDALLHALQQEVAVDGCIMSKMQAIARQLVAMALVGDMRAIKEIFDRIDGKARPAMVAREQPTEAQAGIGLKEQLRQLTAWDFPPPAAAGSDEQCTPSVDMPPPCETGNGIASPLPISEPPASPVASPNVARKLPPVSPSDLARASRLAVDILAERPNGKTPKPYRMLTGKLPRSPRPRGIAAVTRWRLPDLRHARMLPPRLCGGQKPWKGRTLVASHD